MVFPMVGCGSSYASRFEQNPSFKDIFDSPKGLQTTVSNPQLKYPNRVGNNIAEF